MSHALRPPPGFLSVETQAPVRRLSYASRYSAAFLCLSGDPYLVRTKWLHVVQTTPRTYFLLSLGGICFHPLACSWSTTILPDGGTLSQTRHSSPAISFHSSNVRPYLSSVS